METAQRRMMTLEQAEREAVNHPGELVAMSCARDGVYAFAKTYAELLSVLARLEVNLQDVDVDHVAEPGEAEEVGLNLTPHEDGSDQVRTGAPPSRSRTSSRRRL